jgi:hypothetical protein
VKKDAVHQILRENKLKPHRVGTFSRSPDPDFVEKVIDMVGLKEHWMRVARLLACVVLVAGATTVGVLAETRAGLYSSLAGFLETGAPVLVVGPSLCISSHELSFWLFAGVNPVVGRLGRETEELVLDASEKQLGMRLSWGERFYRPEPCGGLPVPFDRVRLWGPWIATWRLWEQVLDSACSG